MAISKIPGVGIDTGSGGVAPSNLSTGGPYWNSSGNVGIGTSSPDALLTLNKASGAADIRFKVGSTLYGNMYASTSDFTINSISAIPLTFGTNNTERARIDSSGNLLVGTTSGVAKIVTQSANSATAIVTGNTSGTALYNAALFYNNGLSSLVGQIAVSGTTCSYNSLSDYRLKENVQPMTGALAKIAALKPCTYTWKVDGEAGQGFIAHELQAVVPDAVTGEKDAVNEDGSIKPQGIDTSFLVATLTAAIKEQQQMIETLQAKVAALEAK